LRQGLQLADDLVGTYRAGALLLRGSPSLLSWLAGWISAEFPPQVLTGHALSEVTARVTVPAVGDVATRWAGQRADQILTDALRQSLGPRYAEQVRHPVSVEPGCVQRNGVFRMAGHRRRYAAQTTDIAYGARGRDHLLDVWRRAELTNGSGAPVLVQVPGGAWTISDKRGQGYPLMSRMAELGWVCVSINYGRSPRNAWPAHLVDVKRASAWVRDHIAEYGGDPEFIAITGGSAGAHLASLAALTAADPALQPGFEQTDTTVQAVAPYYGVYDFSDAEKMHEMMLPFLEHFVMQARYADNPDVFKAASPISHAHAGAPPFFVLHGENDAVIPSTQARAFCTALREAGAPTVGYAELPNAHHAFDTVATVRSQLAADAVAEFLGVVYGRYVGSAVGSRRAPATPAS
jgi:acetyl esterase/lipase